MYLGGAVRGGAHAGRATSLPDALEPHGQHVDGERLSEKNLENVASVAKKDDYSFYIVPNYDEDMQSICEGVAMVHPEFKQKIETIKVQRVAEKDR